MRTNSNSRFRQPLLPAADSELVDKNPSKAVSLFWAAINADHQVESALNGMVSALKQLNRINEAIEAIISFRQLCPQDAQESLDNILVELYYLVDRNPSKAVSLFWAAINAGDHVESALNGMVSAMKQLNRSDEAIEAIISFHQLCPQDAQESLDNILVELYERSGRVEEQKNWFQSRLTSIDVNRTKFDITVRHEYIRLLGNLAWVHLQQDNYKSAEDNYSKALSLEQDKNMRCNLAICLMYMGNMAQAKLELEKVKAWNVDEELYAKSYNRAIQVMHEFDVKKMYGIDDQASFSSFLSREKETDSATEYTYLYSSQPCQIRPPPLLEQKDTTPQSDKGDLFHVIHNLPADSSPYIRAKRVLWVDGNPSKAVSMFWAAINSGDQVDSALKDMAVVMTQLNRYDEAIEAIKSFRQLCPQDAQESLNNILVEIHDLVDRNPSKAVSLFWAAINAGDHVESALNSMVSAMKQLNRSDEAIEAIISFSQLCPQDAQESLDNILVGLYERSGRVEEQKNWLQSRLTSIDVNRTKFDITVRHEYIRLLGNLGWVHLQQDNYKSAEDNYSKALSLEQDKNMRCNLAICLMYMGNMAQAQLELEKVKAWYVDEELYAKSYNRAIQVMHELDMKKRYGIGDQTSFLSFLSREKETDSATEYTYLYSSHPYQTRPPPLPEQKDTTPQSDKGDLFHVIHNLPADDSPYIRAKRVLLVDRNRSKAVSLFWAAINAGDHVESALNGMVSAMKQLNRSDEAIEAIISFHQLCPQDAQESLDNILVELYEQSGRVEEQKNWLQSRLTSIDVNRTKFDITFRHEYIWLLGNLAWVHLQQDNYKSAEDNYSKALSLEQDKNMRCNLAICLMYMGNMAQATLELEKVKAWDVDEELYAKSYNRATQVMHELEVEILYRTGHQASFSSFLTREKETDYQKSDLFHVIHNLPADDSPYIRAKRVLLVDRNPSKAVSLFWAAINSGDQVYSALKDMAVVMKQLDRSDEAIEAIKSFRQLCPQDAQESLDNILRELSKRSGQDIPYDVWCCIMEVGCKRVFSHVDVCHLRGACRVLRQISSDQKIWGILAKNSESYMQKLSLHEIPYMAATERLAALKKNLQQTTDDLEVRRGEVKGVETLMRHPGGMQIGVRLSTLLVTIVSLEDKALALPKLIREEQKKIEKLKIEFERVKRGGRGGASHFL